MAYIEVHTTGGQQRFEFDDGKLTIGRDPRNVVCLKDDLVSRFHCEFEAQSDGYVLRDLQSRNGTRFAETGERIDETPIKPGMSFRVGRAEVRFHDETAAAASQSQPAQSKGRRGWLKRRGKRAESEAPPDTTATATQAQPRESAPAQARPGDRSDFAAGDIESLAHVGQDVPYQAPQVALVNARGETVHPAGEVEDTGKGETAETVRLVRLLLYACIRANASDVHVEPREGAGVVRLRVDGMMVQACEIDEQQVRRLLSLVKVLSDLDITKRTGVQESHFAAEAPDRRIDYRVSYTPSMYGQKLVLRVLDPSNAPRQLSDLKLPDRVERGMRQLAGQDTGMLLVAGPTGSGKTTSLYAMLREIDAQQRNVITIEDPIEYALQSATQIPVDEDEGQTFQSLLKSVLRQDPDVIMVGEVRDAETATIAMQAATTGHLVLSTIHAQDTLGTVFRLLDLGVDPYLIGSTINIVLAQRLVRELCPDCCSQREPTDEEKQTLNAEAHELSQVAQPVGCARCFGTGYTGRRAIFEMLHNTRDVRDTIQSSPTAKELRQVLESSGYISLHAAGYELVRQGVTSLEEVNRVVGQ